MYSTRDVGNPTTKKYSNEQTKPYGSRTSAERIPLNKYDNELAGTKLDEPKRNE